MKVTDLRRKLAAALAAGGLLAPTAVYAADLNTNLVVNSDFESVDINSTQGGLNAVEVLGWADGTAFGFAYSHDGSLDGGGLTIPDYANGGIYTGGSPPAGGGSFYFTSNATDGDILEPGQVSQSVDVSTGDSATLIASGNAKYGLSAIFSTFSTNDDWGNLHLDFLDGGGASLGIAEITPGENVTQWTPLGTAGSIPVGTSSVLVSVYAGGGNDGYIDLVAFRVTDELILPVLDLTVDRDDGSLLLTNQTGSAVNISGYSITSEFEAVAPDNWLSIAENYDAGSSGPDQVDAANDWSELTDSAAHTDLSEGDLDSGTGAALAHTDTINLGNADAWIKNPTEDLVFQYVSGGEVTSGIVNFTGNNDQTFAFADLDTNGVIDADDWDIQRSNQHVDLSDKSLAEAYRLGDLTGDLANNHADFVAFKNAFNAGNGAGSFEAMIAGVPEPTTAFLFLTAGLFLLPGLRPVTNRH